MAAAWLQGQTQLAAAWCVDECEIEQAHFSASGCSVCLLADTRKLNAKRRASRSYQ